jgi:hypothetical protein
MVELNKNLELERPQANDREGGFERGGRGVLGNSSSTQDLHFEHPFC